MNSHFATEAHTSAICREVGERLGQQLKPDNSVLPIHLQTLMQELMQSCVRDHTRARARRSITPQLNKRRETVL
jgi:hypothetical protein